MTEEGGRRGETLEFRVDSVAGCERSERSKSRESEIEVLLRLREMTSLSLPSSNIQSASLSTPLDQTRIETMQKREEEERNEPVQGIEPA